MFGHQETVTNFQWGTGNWLIAADDLAWVKIQRAFSYFNRHTGHRVGVDHDCFQIAVAEQFLNGAKIDVGLQKMTGEAVAKRMHRRTLHMSFVQMPTPVVFTSGHQSQRFGGEQPLSRKFLGCIFIFHIQRTG